MLKLKPCPFCGEQEDVRVVRAGDHRSSTIIRCENCGCALESGEVGESIGKEWNSRFSADLDYFITCLAEEGGEIMELLYLEPACHSQIEVEVNDLIAVADLLHERNVLSFTLEPIVVVGEMYNTQKELFTCVNKIQYFAHKSLRFCIDDSHPQSNITNREQINKLLNELIELIYHDININTWSKAELQPKKDKVLRFLEEARKNKV